MVEGPQAAARPGPAGIPQTSPGECDLGFGGAAADGQRSSGAFRRLGSFSRPMSLTIRCHGCPARRPGPVAVASTTYRCSCPRPPRFGVMVFTYRTGTPQVDLPERFGSWKGASNPVTRRRPGKSSTEVSGCPVPDWLAAFSETSSNRSHHHLVPGRADHRSVTARTRISPGHHQTGAAARNTGRRATGAREARPQDSPTLCGTAGSRGAGAVFGYGVTVTEPRDVSPAWHVSGTAVNRTPPIGDVPPPPSTRGRRPDTAFDLHAASPGLVDEPAPTPAIAVTCTYPSRTSQPATSPASATPRTPGSTCEARQQHHQPLTRLPAEHLPRTRATAQRRFVPGCGAAASRTRSPSVPTRPATGPDEAATEAARRPSTASSTSAATSWSSASTI